MGLTEQPSSEASERAVSPDGPQRRVSASAAVMISSRVNNVFGGKSNPPSDRKRPLRNLRYLLYMTQGFCQVLHGKLREIFVKKHGSILTPVRFVHVQGMSAAMRRRLSSLHSTLSDSCSCAEYGWYCFIHDVGIPSLSGELVFEANKCVEDHAVFCLTKIQGTGFSFHESSLLTRTA